ncbi:MAG: T9SS type A sorting domain-containing protein, partial [Dysgonamonadaceae bacterium]|nr:T9SS type A sorting domain-containing protein [Dysgonamonadaceae bacterium]
FKAFNHETEKEYEATNAPLLFVIDAVNGNPDTPYEVTISDIVTQQIPLAEGWTWISTNVTPTETPIIEQFIQTIGSAGILLKSRDRFIQAPYWIGTLSEINNREMYMVKTGATANLSLAGLPAVPATTSIVLQNGWNWVGYVPQAPLPINEALANLNPQDGDQIKSYSAYSVYSDGSGWTGSLQTLNPGEGYKYFSQTAQSFVYSEWAPAYPSPGIRSNIAGDQPRWAIEKHRYPNNITATVVALLDDTEWQSDRIEIGAFVGEECRGSVFLQYVPQVSEHPYMGFLVVYGDGDEEIRLRVYNHATGEEYDATNKLSFKADTIYGAPATPYRITSLTTGIDDVVDRGLRVYPNPVQSELFIQSERPIERVEITDVSGRAVVSTNSTTVNVSHLPRGVYSAKIFIGNQSFVKKIVKQ